MTVPAAPDRCCHREAAAMTSPAATRDRQRGVDSPVRCQHATDPTLRPHCTLTATLRVGTIALCSSCHSLRSSVGKGHPTVPLPAGPQLDVLAWISTAQQALDLAERILSAAVTRARQNGSSWADIGTQLGITRQAAQQRFARIRS